MKKPLISIIITNYNYEKFIQKAIKSALNQTYKNIELIIIDDASSDKSDEKIKAEISKEDVKYIRHTQNKGIVETRNEGVKMTNGEYFAFLDADDFFNKDYIEKMYEVAQKTKADVIYPDWKLTNLEHNHSFFAHFEEFDKYLLAMQKLHVTAESLVKKSATQGFEFRSKKIAEDWDFFLRLAFSGKKFAHASKVYINYISGKDSRSNSVENPEIKAAEDLNEFVNILRRIKREFPESKIDPEELFLEKYKSEFMEREKSHKKILKLDKRVEELESEVIKRDEIIKSISDSTSYKVGQKITSPVRIIKSSLKK